MTDMTPEQALEWLEGLRNTTGDQVCAEIEAGKAAEAAQAFRAALEAAREDALRLDALEAMVNESPKKAFLLHHGMLPSDRYQYVGLGLSNTGRTLRQAIDQARGKGWEGGLAMTDRYERIRAALSKENRNGS